MFYKKAVLKNFAVFAEKHLYWSVFFNKIRGLRPINLLKKRLQHRCFPVNIAKLLRTAILKNVCEGLFLYFKILQINFFEKWKIGRSKTWKSRKNYSEFSYFQLFALQPKSKTQIKNLGKEFPRFQRFQSFPSF